jgi:hypothetical protein
VLQPLAVASNVTQGDDARLDVVLLTLANLFRIYADERAFKPDIRKVVHASLEKRWAKADRPAFLFAAIFNPYIRRDCFNTRSFIFDFPLEETYMHLYNIKNSLDVPFDVRAGFLAYVRREGRWSDVRMGLAALQRKADALVRFSSHLYYLDD